MNSSFWEEENPFHILSHLLSRCCECFVRFKANANLCASCLCRHCKPLWVETEAWLTCTLVVLLPDSASGEYQPSLPPSSRNVHQKRCEEGSLVSPRSWPLPGPCFHTGLTVSLWPLPLKPRVTLRWPSGSISTSQPLRECVEGPIGFPIRSGRTHGHWSPHRKG